MKAQLTLDLSKATDATAWQYRNDYKHPFREFSAQIKISGTAGTAGDDKIEIIKTLNSSATLPTETVISTMAIDGDSSAGDVQSYNVNSVCESVKFKWTQDSLTEGTATIELIIKEE